MCIVGCMATIGGLYPLDASSTLSSSRDNQKPSQVLPNVPRKVHRGRSERAGSVRAVMRSTDASLCLLKNTRCQKTLWGSKDLGTGC